MSERYEDQGAETPGGVRLPEELRALGRSLGPAGPTEAEAMVERVLERIRAERVPVPVAEPLGPGGWARSVRRWTRRHWRALSAALCGLLTVLVLTPPVRAAVSDWFGFGGVEVRHDPSAVPSPGASVPGCGPSVSLAEAERRAGFRPLVPEALGTPDAVTVTPEPADRLVISLCWRSSGGTVRLDEFPAVLSPGFTKLTPQLPEQVALHGADGVNSEAYWFPVPHELSLWLLDGHGGDYVTRSVRPAGPTLLWVHADELTLRLEGVASKARAVEIAASADR